MSNGEEGARLGSVMVDLVGVSMRKMVAFLRFESRQRRPLFLVDGGGGRDAVGGSRAVQTAE